MRKLEPIREYTPMRNDPGKHSRNIFSNYLNSNRDASLEWKRLKKLVLQRDKFICQICKKDFKNSRELLTVDHIIEARINSTKWFDINNLRTLCISCHNKRHLEEQQLSSWIKRKKSINESSLSLKDFATVKKEKSNRRINSYVDLDEDDDLDD